MVVYRFKCQDLDDGVKLVESVNPRSSVHSGPIVFIRLPKLVMLTLELIGKERTIFYEFHTDICVKNLFPAQND